MDKINEVINRLQGKGGEEYQGSGSVEHKSRRNPVREDTSFTDSYELPVATTTSV